MGLKIRIPLGLASLGAWFAVLAMTDLPWWLSLPLGLLVGNRVGTFMCRPLTTPLASKGDLPDGMQVKIVRGAPSYRWAVLPDPYRPFPPVPTRPHGRSWWYSDELARGWSCTLRLAEWRGHRALRRLEKVSKANGRNRQAQAHPRDPRPNRAALAPRTTLSLTFNAPGAVRADDGTRQDGLDTVQSDIPILAHRAAKLRFHGDGKPWDSVTDYGRPFGRDASAICSRHGLFWFSVRSDLGAHGPVPDVDCTCGFYALPPDLDATHDENSRVTLLVELSGQVIEHQRGYRAGHQRVIECRLPACRYCGRPADQVDVLDGEMVQTACSQHVPAQRTPEDPNGLGRVWLSVEDVARSLPVPVTLAGEYEDDK